MRDRIERTLEAGGRVLLAGAPGTGKSTLAAEWAVRFAAAGVSLACVGCDPGSPAFGPPGAICLGEWRDEGWALVDLEPLCTLDAARFRLPLVQAVRRLLERTRPGALLIDMSGAIRGVPGAELLAGVAAAARADLVVLLERDGRVPEVERLLAALTGQVERRCGSEAARAPSKPERARRRTALWNAYLEDAVAERWLDLEGLVLAGMPPSREAPGAWRGRQVALLDGSGCAGFGEIVGSEGTAVRVRLCGAEVPATGLLVRDAQRGPEGLLGTAPPPAERVRARAARSPGRNRDEVAERREALQLGPFVATLVNGVFGDPLLLVRVRHGRTLLFDLGEADRLGARTAHRVTDVFITHAHIDHIGGFFWLLRARIGDFPACRLYGPPGLAANVSGMVNGVHWDRAGEGAPRFDVAELHPDGRVRRFAVKAGESRARETGETELTDGILVDEPAFRVRAAMLDHRTPILAFALESAREISVRKERLAALGLPAGPWLARLKHEIAAGREDETVELPGGERRTVRALADALVTVARGTKLAYATDLADTADNRRKLADLARGADALFCEATFREADAHKAERTAHLTTRACAEIAAAAEVERLVPFHFSRRYESDADAVYRELRARFGAVIRF
ncbi:MAG TPA: MBL fold metallo-hydrolase [Gammaproteobacteria bacterium]